ncbi:glucuronoxylan 4-O-methyltransferase 1 [Amborella trichopoda]|uniref:glucuronoxylan 4-O-methyltransferase 1 n=1 Tax=Amborella trichopoda TaxID=13333 RepID=UPI0005D3AF40|nr:glucuronoxylan 4-O-methyltransferase 1 [Amborella trichopoda]|eukprot:XP_011624968.1 glucuronoxylan 4-O-methyltransferase 1 [Amborella trichopoda]
MLSQNKTIFTLLLLLFFTLSALSLLRLLRISSIRPSRTHLTAPVQTHIGPLLTHQSKPTQTHPEPTGERCCIKLAPALAQSLAHFATAPTPRHVSPKELALISRLFSTPKRVLIFGHTPLSPFFQSLNHMGKTLFIEPNQTLIEETHRAHPKLVLRKSSHWARRDQAFELLKRARAEPSCGPRGPSRACPLAMGGLGNEVRKRDWDLVVVDDPRGESSMAAIYEAGVIARKGRVGKWTDVIVCGVDRRVEMWYSREFLCEENLVGSKGNTWHFRIRSSGSHTFCSAERH